MASLLSSMTALHLQGRGRWATAKASLGTTAVVHCNIEPLAQATIIRVAKSRQLPFISSMPPMRAPSVVARAHQRDSLKCGYVALYGRLYGPLNHISGVMHRIRGCHQTHPYSGPPHTRTPIKARCSWSYATP